MNKEKWIKNLLGKGKKCVLLPNFVKEKTKTIPKFGIGVQVKKAMGQPRPQI